MQQSTPEPIKVSPEVLDLDHYHTLTRAVRNVLSTDLAEITFAQLFDGLPLIDTVWDMKGCLLLRGHPLIDHDRLCDGALEQARLFRAAFDPNVLHLDSRVMQSYQNAAPGTREFNMRLMELVAASIHQIGVLLFQTDKKLHSKEDIDAVVSYRKPTEWLDLEGGRRILDEPLPPRPTLFYHAYYTDFEEYPHGLADMAGYWAEDRILGGITLFDRGESGTECRDIWFHSGRQDTTFRVWRLSDSQFTDLVAFLLSENRPAPPFPLLVTDNNRNRHDPWDAKALHHIFRDPWERTIPHTRPESRDVRSAGDYPEVEDMFQKINEAVEAHPELEFNWTSADEQRAFPWMADGTASHDDDEPQDQSGQAVATSEGDADSSPAKSPQQKSPPGTP